MTTLHRCPGKPDEHAPECEHAGDALDDAVRAWEEVPKEVQDRVVVGVVLRDAKDFDELAAWLDYYKHDTERERATASALRALAALGRAAGGGR